MTFTDISQIAGISFSVFKHMNLPVILGGLLEQGYTASREGVIKRFTCPRDMVAFPADNSSVHFQEF